LRQLGSIQEQNSFGLFEFGQFELSFIGLLDYFWTTFYWTITLFFIYEMWLLCILNIHVQDLFCCACRILLSFDGLDEIFYLQINLINACATFVSLKLFKCWQLTFKIMMFQKCGSACRPI